MARKSSGVIVPHAPRWHQRLAAWIISALVRAVSATLRFRWEDRSAFFDGAPCGPAIYALWHNRLVLSMAIYDRYIKKRNRASGLAAMVSASKDGAFLAAILECFKVQPVRGSSSRRGPQALLELTTWAERNYDLAITPDGPRGPRYQVQDGIMSLAQVTSLPIVPVSYQLSWKIPVRSWDRFQVPLPFAVCQVVFEKPLYVPRQATDEEREALRLQLEARLKGVPND
ncbi:conserved hypothetical protein [Verrucomicrobia bacterium]|nr:conserved hypothetical protein [Verrucomicrobiota bacterium]